jgi:peptide-methionine (S)-S-oxide reductase
MMKKTLLIAAASGFVALSLAHAQERAVPVPAPKVDQYPENRKDVAVFAGGCFWGVQGVFEHVKGVTEATAGYAGGASNTATYDAVTTETTGHAEAVRIVYNPAQISYGKLLQIYFSVAHNPTELNRQGPDSGTSYRSAIFIQNPAQKDIATKYIAQLQAARAFKAPIVTKLEHGTFYPAEAYHQHFLARNPSYPYIVINDAPKVAALKTMYPALYR